MRSGKTVGKQTCSKRSQYVLRLKRRTPISISPENVLCAQYIRIYVRELRPFPAVRRLSYAAKHNDTRGTRARREAITPGIDKKTFNILRRGHRATRKRKDRN